MREGYNKRIAYEVYLSNRDILGRRGGAYLCRRYYLLTVLLSQVSPPEPSTAVTDDDGDSLFSPVLKRVHNYEHMRIFLISLPFDALLVLTDPSIHLPYETRESLLDSFYVVCLPCVEYHRENQHACLVLK